MEVERNLTLELKPYRKIRLDKIPGRVKRLIPLNIVKYFTLIGQANTA